MPNQSHDDQPLHEGQDVDAGIGVRRRTRLGRYVLVIAPYILLLAPGIFIQPAKANDAFNVGLASAQIEYVEANCGKTSIGRFTSTMGIAKRDNPARFREARDAQWKQLIEQQNVDGIASVCKALLASPLSTFLKDKQ